jgi:hypothetical protein
MLEALDLQTQLMIVVTATLASIGSCRSQRRYGYACDCPRPSRIPEAGLAIFCDR